MKRFLIFFCGLLVVIALAIAALPFILTTDFVAEQLKTAVTKTTGRTLALNGPLKFKFWPTLMVEANDVTLSNPPAMYKGQFAAIKTLRIKVAAKPLLSRQVEILEMTLLAPRLSLVVDGKGNSNWDFAQTKTQPTNKDQAARGDQAPEGKAQPSIDKISLAPIVIKNGDIRFLDERAGTSFVAKSVNLTIKIGGLSGPLDVKGNLIWNKQKVAINSFTKSPQRLTQSGSPIDLAITSSLLTMQFNGRAKISQGVSLAGTINAKTPSIRKLASWTGTPLAPGKGLGAFSAKAAVDLNGKTIKLSKANVSLDGMNARGNLTINLKGVRPLILARIGMDQINVNTYMEKGKKSAPQKTVRSQGWSKDKIDFSGLKAVDADLTIATSRIVYKDVIIGKTNLSVKLKSGKLDARLNKMAFYDGNAIGRIILNGASKRPVIQGSLSANGLNAFRLLKDFADFKRLKGTGQMQLSLASSGKSQQEIVSRLAGIAKLKFTNGSIRGINIASMVRKVQKSVLGGWDKESKKDTDFSEFSMSFKIKDGIAQNDDLKLLGPLVRVTGKGEVDMLRQRLDYRVNPKLVATLKGQGGKQKLKGIAVPIIIKGPWSKPKIYPDIKGILSNPKAAFNSLNKLIKKGGGVNLKEASKKVTKTLEKNARTQVEKALGKKVDDAQVKDAKKKGKKLLKSLFGKKEKPAPTQPVPSQ